jgi:cell division protein FtsL
MMAVLRKPWVIALLLWCAVLVSAAGAVYTRHRARELFGELERLHRAQGELEATWGKLQIEQSSWSAHAYVEGFATSKLKMAQPDPATIHVVLQ